MRTPAWLGAPWGARGCSSHAQSHTFYAGLCESHECAVCLDTPEHKLLDRLNPVSWTCLTHDKGAKLFVVVLAGVQVHEFSPFGN